MTKRGPQGETGYINQWITLRNGEVGTKHVFAGTTRVVSKLVKQDKPNAKRKGRIVYEKDQYYYHPDHLGTTAYITHTNGQVYQHLEYFPFGETWVEEHSNKQRTPYQFTAKELDEETGLYYFGARYYDPRTSVWQSADPILEKYVGAQLKALPNKGAFNSRNMALYTYSYHNPVVLRDPDGNLTVFVHGTFASPKSADRQFLMAVGATFNEDVVQFDWSGKNGLPAGGGAENSTTARRNAGQRLAAFINSYPLAEGEKINLIGHSHGGNVIKEASQKVSNDRKLNAVMFLGTPHRATHELNGDTIAEDATLMNVYDNSDLVQLLGQGISGPSRDLGGFLHEKVEAPNASYFPVKNGLLDDHSELDSKAVWDALDVE